MTLASYLNSYDYCQKISERALASVVLFDVLMGRNPPLPPQIQTQITDLVRTGVVLSVSAMDAYFTRRFVEVLVPYVKKRKLNKDLLKLLERAGLDTSQAIEMAMMKRPLRRLRSLLYKHLERKVTQRFDVIDKLYNAYGVPNLTRRAAAATGRKKLLRSVEILVHRRHKIVHEGDLDSRGQLRSIDSEEVKRRMRDLCVLVDESERIIRSIV